MEYNISKMILQTAFWLAFFGAAVHCFPSRQEFKLPDFDISTPEEVNSLERDEPLRRSIDPKTGTSNNIDDTVQEVEEILRSNPDLPRLTRGEILDLLENITDVDQEKLSKIGKTRDPKAVMVVMPYTPNNEKDMEDLYTKAPVTHLIGAEPFKTKEETDKNKHLRRRPPVQYNDTDNDLAKKPLHTEEKKKYSASISDKFTKPSSPPRISVRRKRPEATTEVPSTDLPKPTLPTTYHPKTRRPVRRRTTVPPTQHPNHRYHEDFVPTNGIRIIEAPQLITSSQKKDVLPDLDLEENIKQEVVNRHPPISASYVTLPPNDFKPVTTTTQPLSEDLSVPESLRSVMKDLNLDAAINSEKKEQPVKTADEQNRIKEILASIGVLTESTTPTTTTLMPNADNVAESLSPEMRDLLMSFGLLPNPNEKPLQVDTDKFYPEKAEVNPESYIGFKPLPDDGPNRDDMEALLASFGLGRSARREKSMKSAKTEETTYNFDMVPDDLKGVISDLGIAEARRQEKRIESPPVEKQHVFNPDTQYATEEELKKLEKLLGMIKQLEKMNGTATEDDLKKIDLDGLKELVTSLNGNSSEPPLVTLDEKETFSPDPNNFDFGFSKNEVKRQETNESTTAATTTTTTSTSTAKVESETPSLTDLEASFGGQTETETATEAPVPETTTKRTGFYYLVDWNTFLDIDDTKGKRVNLRFQPTIGDPKRFLSVSVP